jgi:hypothetical protein
LNNLAVTPPVPGNAWGNIAAPLVLAPCDRLGSVSYHRTHATDYAHPAIGRQIDLTPLTRRQKLTGALALAGAILASLAL